MSHSQAGGQDNKSASPAWHSIPSQQVIAMVESDRAGISSTEALQRLQRYGPNRLKPPERRGPLLRFLSQFHNLLIYILLGASLVTAWLQHWIDTSVILGVVVINTIIGFIQEGKAEKALDAIRQMLSLQATVLREGKRTQISAEEIVPGDIVLLQSGDKVPADLRLVETKNLRVDEALLTGESQPVEKSNVAVPEDTAVADRTSLAYSGTLVVYGQGTGVVIATGENTEIGRIGTMLEQVQELATPLLRQIETFGRWLTIIILSLAAAAFAYGLLFGRYAIDEIFLAAVGLAVAAIPEGLPAIMTITLALGVRKMAQRNAIIRRLPAVEALGAVTVICTDKTGTLTRNEMTVQRLVTAEQDFEVSGVGYDPHGGFSVGGKEISASDHLIIMDIAHAGLLCNDAELRETDGAWRVEGDPTEGALISLAMKAGFDAKHEHELLPRTDVIPFESDRCFMATLHHDHAGHGFIYVKGAPERVLEICTSHRSLGEVCPIDRAYWFVKTEELAAQGQRLLALAIKHVGAAHRELNLGDIEKDFTLLGLFGIIDPPRAEAIGAVRECQSAGIQVKMITGDHAITAQAISAQLGIGNGQKVLKGGDLEVMDDAQLKEAVADVNVFARTSPAHKLRLVTTLQARGEIVAMTGDGVNDAPALKRAEVGVAMGRKGTEAAKAAAEMVLADDNFASIVQAVKEGRTIYDNIRKTIIFIMPTNGGEAGMMIIAILLGMTLPITPAQILWINMVTAVTLSLALALEEPEADVMKRPPRDAQEPLLTGFMVWRIIFVSVLLMSGSLGLYMWEQSRGLGVEASRTVAVNAIVMGEIFYLFNCRHILAPVRSWSDFFGNRYVLIAIAVLAVIQMLFTYTAVMQRLFDTTAIDLAAWARISAFGALLFVMVEIEKYLIRYNRASQNF